MAQVCVLKDGRITHGLTHRIRIPSIMFSLIEALWNTKLYC